MIYQSNDFFYLDTKDTSYAFSVMKTGQLEHLYYGKKCIPDTLSEEQRKKCMESLAEALREKRAFGLGNTIACSVDHPEVGLEDWNLEVSFFGQGDIREPFIELEFQDGSSTLDFQFEKSEIITGKTELSTLPSSYDEKGEVQELIVTLKDAREDVYLELHYAVFEEDNVITRFSKVINLSKDEIVIRRLMSMQLDCNPAEYTMSTFHGSWIHEMNKRDYKVVPGLYCNRSNAGVTSSRANNFFMVSKDACSEDQGECMGFHLIYSGNHMEACEMTECGKVRIMSGINPVNFSWNLAEGEAFEAPEAVMTYSNHGFGGMSQNLHGFIQEHIVRGTWKKKERPILINSWEAAYFNFDEKKLLKLAKEAKNVGIELFVMDDGWFGKRNSDTCSLGDWVVNKEKLPDGLEGLCKKIQGLGMQLGIWVEPEMVNEDSDLYRAHPDWAVKVPGRTQALGRNQMFLDLTRFEVREYIIEAMSLVFSAAEIQYVKWDMNRIFSDAFSKVLPANRQKEFYHRYIMGFYEVAKTLTERFPEILFEGCAAGGNRFDLGVLCYFPQIWASDNTDAICRATIQYGYSYGYPQSVISAHVSGTPNHQTLRVTPIETRFDVAAFAQLGYECNLVDMKKEDLDEIKEQVVLYKEYRDCFQYGDFYRLRNGNERTENPSGIFEWICVSKDRTKAALMMLQTQAVPGQSNVVLKTKGLQEDALYHLRNIPKKLNIKQFGDLVNTASPIHIKPDSLVQQVASIFIKLDGEEENYILSGETLNTAGFVSKQAYSATGFNEQIRVCQDFGARLYLLSKVME